MKHTVVYVDLKEERLRQYLDGIFPSLTTNNAIKKAIKNGDIKVNGATSDTGYKVQVDDVISYEPVIAYTEPRIEIPIIFEDQYIAVLNKPAGLTSSGNSKHNLANYLSSILKPSKKKDALPEPLLIHRLDRATSGLIVAAKTAKSRVVLGAMLADGVVTKEYLALVQGHVGPIKVIDAEIEGKTAKTIVKSITHTETVDPTSLVRLSLVTGRTHQIRIHMKSVGHPLVGDAIHNDDGLSFGRGLFLAATSIGFDHPITGEHIGITIDPPKKFLRYISHQYKR